MCRFARSFGSLFLAATVLPALACVTTSSSDGPPKTAFERAESRRNLGVDHIKNGRFPFAIRELRHALTLNEEDPITHLFLAEAYMFRDKTPEALVHTERSLELDPENHESRLQLSTLYIIEGRLADAVAQADVLIDDPTFASPWRALTNRGWAQVKQRRFELARKSFAEALEYHPSWWPAMLNLGILEQIEGDHLASLRYFTEALEFEPGPGPEAECNYRMAENYVSLGHRERAVYHLEHAIEVSPHGRWGRQSREYLALLN